jgi:glycosyltransferase involved in cell wall biosynthesis
VTSAKHDGGRVVVVQMTIPGYRGPFFDELSGQLGARLLVVSGEEDWSTDVKHAYEGRHVVVRNVFLGRRQLLWQSGALRHVLAAEVAVLSLNPRILTTWAALALRRLRGRRTVLWGHAWPRRGPASPTDKVRGVMRRLADGLIVYTESEATAIRDRSAVVDVTAAPNALYRRDEIGAVQGEHPPTDFVFVGRLNAAKKPGLLLEAFVEAADVLPGDVRLVFVGDGPLRTNLEARAQSSGVGGRVIFRGHVAGLDELRHTYAHAIASVSPGYVGLSLIQTLGFGVPMLIARQEPHAPEIEAAIEGENSVSFDSDRPASLASALVEAANRRDEWVSRRSAIAEAIRDDYCIDHMVSSFIDALRLEERP